MLYKGVLITAASGKIDGAVASHNHGGQYFRTLTIPTNPNTSRQIFMRSAIAAAYLNWTDLSPETRGLWENYARSLRRTNRIGDQRHNSGYNEFVRAYTYRHYAESQLALGLTTLLDTVDLPEAVIGSPITAGFPVDNDHIRVQWDASLLAPSSPESAILVEVSGVRTAPGVIAAHALPATRNSFKGPWQLAAGLIFSTAIHNYVDLALAATATTGQRAWLRCRISSLNNGLSNTVYAMATAP